MSGTPNGAASQSSRAASGAAPRWTTAAMVAARATAAPSPTSSASSPSSSSTPRARPPQQSLPLAPPPPPQPSLSSSSSSHAPPSLPATSSASASTSTSRIAPPANGRASPSIASAASSNGNGSNPSRSKAPPPPPLHVTAAAVAAAAPSPSASPTLPHKAPSSTPSVSTPTSRNPAAPTRPRHSAGSSSSLTATAAGGTTTPSSSAAPSVARRDLQSTAADDTPIRDAPRRDTAKRDTPKVDAPRRDTPRRDTPKRDTPRRETPRRDTPKRGETPKSDPVPPTADRSSSVGAAPSVASSSTAGPSNAPNGVAAEDDQQPKKKQKRRGWKGWAVEIIDEYGNKIVRSPSPEPERLPGAPPRPRGRPRTRPQPQPEPQSDPAPPDQEDATQPAGVAGDLAAPDDAAAVENAIAVSSPPPPSPGVEAADVDLPLADEPPHDAAESVGLRRLSAAAKPARDTTGVPERESSSPAAVQDPAPAKPASEARSTSSKEGVKRGRPRESLLSKRRLNTSASPPPSGKRAKPAVASRDSSRAPALSTPDEPTPPPPHRAEARGPRRSDPGPAVVTSDPSSTATSKAFETPASVPIQRVRDIAPGQPSTPTPAAAGARAKLPKIAPAPLRQLGNGTKSNGRASPAAIAPAPNPSSARGKQSLSRDDSPRASPSSLPGTTTPRMGASEASRASSSKPRSAAPSNQRTLDEFTVEKPKAARGLAGPVYPSPPESDGRDVQMEVDEAPLPPRKEAVPRREKGSVTPRESVTAVQTIARVLPAVSDEARFIIEANEKRRELEKREVQKAAKRNDDPKVNRPRSSEDGREARRIWEGRRPGPQDDTRERGREEPPAHQRKQQRRPMDDDVVFIEERGQFWNGKDTRQEREREDRTHHSNGRDFSKDRSHHHEGYDHLERHSGIRNPREFEDRTRRHAEQWDRGVETPERRDLRDYREHPDPRFVRDREVLDPRGHPESYRSDSRNAREERDQDPRVPNGRHRNYAPPPQNGPYTQPYHPPPTAYPAGYPQQYVYHPSHPAQFTPPLSADPIHRPRQAPYPPDAPPLQFSPRPRSEGSEWPFPATRTSPYGPAVHGAPVPHPRAQPSPAAPAAAGPSRRDAAPPPVTAAPPPHHVAGSSASGAPPAGYRPVSAPSLSYVDVVPVPFPTGPPYVAPEPRAPSRLSDSAPQVILAPRGNEPPMPTSRADIPWARLHANGFEGLDPSLDENARGFVENVKNNLRTLVSTYFVEPSNMRDAFLESIGRDLVDLGWQLTDGSDGALYSRGAPKP
ncbi:uncharacterized protein LOC62_02G002369 [Vanrija pseudolonga]|uniref:Uncharacterized protein n=1 Tax=Vanrija pseudolonga TaxID=143232 RepID=A0AAF0Y5W2_9TREE|nr:hypothetical protein LOC62_02G002369 [Vanrija pseudolonga]